MGNKFDLGRAVKDGCSTVGGRKARIVATDVLGAYNVLALVEYREGSLPVVEMPKLYDADGCEFEGNSGLKLANTRETE